MSEILPSQEELLKRAHQGGEQAREQAIICLIKDFWHGWNKEKSKKLSYVAMDELIEYIMQNKGVKNE